MKKALIIGAGLGGLATAMRLTSKGFDVHIIEKYHQAGGRLNQLKSDGFTFDMGPSFFSMSYEFDELFNYCKIQNPLKYQELHPLYAVNFSDRENPFLIYKDIQKLSKVFAQVEPDFERKINKYLERASQIFHDTEYKIVKKNFTSKLHYFKTLTTIPPKHAPKLFASLWNELERHFDSQEVKVIFSLVAFFLGSTPFETPAVYSLLNYTELKHDGYWNIKGGMYTITEKILEYLKSKNVKITYNTEIIDVEEEGGKIKSFVDQAGRKWTADIYVSNSDAASFRGRVLKRKKYTEKKLQKMEWTLAPFTIYLGVKGRTEKLYHHNYFLGTNFKEYANNIFKTSIAPEKPYYYVNVSSKSNPDCAPEGCENLFILCPVPDLRYKADWSDAETLSNNIIEDLSKRIDFPLRENIITKTILTPVQWQNKFNLYQGSGLGLSHGMGQVGGLRPSNKDENFENLFYVGASTTPGTGLPIVVISSKLVTEKILEAYGSV